MKKLNVQKLTLCGVMAALVFVMTYFHHSAQVRT